MTMKRKGRPQNINPPRLNIGSLLLVGVCWYWLSLSVGLAQENRPEAGAIYDQPTITQWIGNVGEPKNAAALKEYFRGRGTPPYAKRDAYPLLKSKLVTVTEGSKPWFALQSLVAFAAFRSASNLRGEGYDCYKALFNKSEEAIKAGANEEFCQALCDFTEMQVGSYGRLGYGVEQRAEEVLVKALKGYLALLKQNQACTQEPNWISAIYEHPTREFTKLVDVALQDATFPKSYRLLKTAAVIYSLVNREQALKYFEAAKPLLPRDDVPLIESHYRLVVNLWGWERKLKEAIEAQKELVALVGRGYGKLADMYAKAGNMAAIESILEKVKAPDADEEDIKTVASILAFGSAEEKYHDQALSVWLSYLKAPRRRDLTYELIARNSVGYIYLNRQDWKAAQEVLDVSQLPKPLPGTQAADFYGFVQEKFATAAKKLAATPHGN